MEQRVYRFKKDDKENGVIRVLKEGIKFQDYFKRLESKYPEQSAIKVRKPSIDTLMNWDMDGGCESVDGCWVELDGVCEHGFPSWLLVLGMI